MWYVVDGCRNTLGIERGGGRVGLRQYEVRTRGPGALQVVEGRRVTRYLWTWQH